MNKLEIFNGDLRKPVIPKGYTKLEMFFIQNNLRIVENNRGDKFMYGTDIHRYLEVGSRWNDWTKRKIENGFYDINKEYFPFYEKSDGDTVDIETYNSNQFKFRGLGYTKEILLPINTAKKVCMSEGNEKSDIIQDYFLDCEEIAHRVSDKKDLLYNAIMSEDRMERQNSLSDFLDIYREDILLTSNDGRNVKLNRSQVCDEILRYICEKRKHYKGIEGYKDFIRNDNSIEINLKVVIDMCDENFKKFKNKVMRSDYLHEYLESMNLGKYEKIGNDKNRTFQPNNHFMDILAHKGYCYTGNSNKGDKIKVDFNSNIVKWITTNHINSYIDYLLKQ